MLIVASLFVVDNDGVLSVDEFRKLCSELSTDLNEQEIRVALDFIDTNKDGSIEFDEFVRFWLKQVKGSQA